jgi:hypothetical protein
MQTRCCLLAAAIASLLALSCFAATTERVSVATDGTQANDMSQWPSISADGTRVAFASYADNLVPEDRNSELDIFVFDRATHLATRVSVAEDGSEAERWSARPMISADGQWVAFESAAQNLVPDDTNSATDVFIHDIMTGDNTRASEVACLDDGAQCLSADGRLLAFAPACGEGVVFERDTGESTPVTVTSDGIRSCGRDLAISAEGRYVAFVSDDCELMPGEWWLRLNVFLHDRETGVTERVSRALGQGEPDDDCHRPAISADGRFVAFYSHATNLIPQTLGQGGVGVHLYLWERETQQISLVDVGLDGGIPNYGLEDGVPAALSHDGRFVVFYSPATDLVPGTPVDEEGNPLAYPLYVRDRIAGKTSCVSVSTAGAMTHGWDGSISADGRWVAFSSDAPGLVPDDTNGAIDIFVRDRLTFPDVPLDHWAFYEIGGCNMAGVVQGYHDGIYRPDLVVTRDQMAVYIARALAGGAEHVPGGPRVATFGDVPNDFWAYDAVEYATASNVVQGYSDGNYHPDWEVTRAQMAVFIARSIVTPAGEAGLDSYHPPDFPSFPDVPTYYWCYKHVEYLKAQAVVSGYPDGTYLPTRTVTRDQMSAYVQRAFELPI